MPVIRDSAGIRIIEYHQLTAKADMRASPRPFLTLGGKTAHAEAQFDERQTWLAVQFLSNGTMVVNDFQALKFFDRQGRLLRSVTREGAASLGQTREVCVLRGDSLLTIDYADGHISLWDSTGKHLRSFARAGAVPLNGCTQTGQVLTKGPPSPGVRSGNAFDYIVRRPDGTEVGRLAGLPAATYRGPLFFEPGILPGSAGVVVADPERFAVELRNNISGKLNRVTRVKGARRPVTEEEWQSHVAFMVPRSATMAQAGAIVARHKDNKPDFYPAFRRSRVDVAGRIWLEDDSLRTRWMVFAHDGTYLGEVQTPPGEMVAIGSDFIVLRGKDDKGAVTLNFHRLLLRQLQP